MDENEQEVIETIETEVVETSAPSQEETDFVQQELDRVETEKRSKLERLKFNKERLEREIAEQELKEGKTDEDRPLTLRDFRVMQAQEAQATAATLAEAIVDDTERKLVLHHLENTIKPSGDAQTDLRNARLIVNSVKNGMLAEESARVAKARTAPSSPSAPPKQKTAAQLSPEEITVMRGFGLTEEEAVAALQS